MTVFVGLIGHSVKHSISAAFQQAALDHLGIDARYLVWDVPSDGLRTKIDELRQPDHLGANVTIPHKEAVIPLLDGVERMAGQIGAVNTIVSRGGRLEGLNTDASGFLLALRREAGFDPRDRTAVLLGAGGAARAAAFVLLGNGIASLTIVNRDQGRAKTLEDDLEGGTRSAELKRVKVVPWKEEELALAIRGCDLLVNCTPIGTWSSPWEGQSPVDENLITDACLVFDLVYNPAETPLLAAARKAGARTLPGLPMLVYQGASSFQLWTGQEAPIAVMMEAARRALGST